MEVGALLFVLGELAEQVGGGRQTVTEADMESPKMKEEIERAANIAKSRAGAMAVEWSDPDVARAVLGDAVTSPLAKRIFKAMSGTVTRAEEAALRKKRKESSGM